jgi:hypothetical protein
VTLHPITKYASDVATAVKRQFGDESGVQITDSDILRWINDGQREIAASTRCLKTIGTVSTVAGVNSYDISGINIIAIDSIRYNNVPLEISSFEESEKLALSTQVIFNPNVNPTNWYTYGDNIIIWPTPTVTGDTISAYIVKYPAEVTGTSSLLSIPDSFYNVLINYVLSKAYALDEDWNASNITGNDFQSGLQMIGAENQAQLTYPVISLTSEEMFL